jgi:hypothetical protein
MNVTTTIGTLKISQQMDPSGAFNNTTWDNLPGAGSKIIILKKGPSANKFQDWAYYDFAPAQCNIPLSITLNGGVSVVLSQETSSFWPLNIQGTFADNAAPTLIATNTHLTVPCGSGGSNVNFLVTSVDNCSSNPTITYSKEPGSFFPVGVTTVTATSMDENGNTSQISFPVTVNTTDKLAPTLNLPAPILANNEPGICGARVKYEVSATDDCPEKVKIEQTQGLPSGSIFPTGKTLNIFKATDASGNSSILAFTVTIEDKDAPKAPILPVITGSCSANIKTIPVAIDACEGPILGKTKDSLTFTEQGKFLINWTFSDTRGNTISVYQQVIIKDYEKPIVPILNNISGVCSATAPTPFAEDNCAGIISGTTTNPTTFTKQGVHLINWKFDDGRGNISTAKQYVIIRDVSAPTVLAQNVVLHLDESGNAVLKESEVDNGSTDNCTIANYWLDKKYFDSSNIGTNIITFGVTDTQGNFATKTATVTIMNKASVLSAYPNPFSSQSTVTFTLITDEKNVSLDFYNSKGVLIKNLFSGAYKANQNFSYNMDTSQIKGGLYFFRLSTSKEVLTFKAISAN